MGLLSQPFTVRPVVRPLAPPTVPLSLPSGRVPSGGGSARGEDAGPRVKFLPSPRGDRGGNYGTSAARMFIPARSGALVVKNGAADGNRTHDLFLTKEVLYRLSHSSS